MSTDAQKAPAKEPRPPMTITTKVSDPTVAAMEGSVTKVLPPITPAKAANPVPTPKTHMNTWGTLWPKVCTVCGWVKAA